MEIILWRHAEADDNYVDDLNRALTQKGREQAEITAEWLANRLPDNYLLLSSQAKRAKQTAAYLSEPLVDAIFNPGNSAVKVKNQLNQLIKEYNRPLVLVGHQPFLGQVASLYKRGDSMSQPVKKSGIYWLKERSGVWYYKAILSPKLIK